MLYMNCNVNKGTI